MRGLLYPLLGLVALTLATLVAAGVLTGLAKWRVARATRYARWEPFAQPQGGGRVEFGVRLLARWGAHEKQLQRDSDTITVEVNDLLARYDAMAVMTERAKAFNELRDLGGRPT